MGSCTRCRSSFGATTGCSAVTALPGSCWRPSPCWRREPQPSEAQIRDGLKGNLCRCTGYANVVQAVRAAAAAGEGC